MKEGLMKIFETQNIINKNQEFQEFLQLNLLQKELIWLAGGAIRCLFSGETIQDYDLFFKNEQVLKQTIEKLDILKAKLVFKCPKGELYTYRINDMKIQLITKRFYESAKELIDTFDFTICQFSFDTETVEIGDNSIHHLIKKELHVNKLEYPVATMNRLVKYSKKGYKHSIACMEIFEKIQSGVLNNEFNPDNLRLYLD